MQVNLNGLIAVIRDVLSQSKTIGGRLYCLKSPSVNFNASNFGTLIKDALGGIEEAQKYPCVIMVPPFKIKPNDEKGYALYRMQLYFLVLDRRNSSGDIKNVDLETNLSQQSFTDDWNDTQIMADDFFKALRNYLTGAEPMLVAYISEDKDKRQYRFIAGVGNDRANGCHVNFDMRIWEGENCNPLPDYPEAMVVSVTNFSPNTLNKQ